MVVRGAERGHKHTIAAKSGRANRGLFHGEDWHKKVVASFAENKSKVAVKPNAHRRSFYSEILHKKITLKITTEALRQIEKLKGFDNYIMETPDRTLNSLKGEYSCRIHVHSAFVCIYT